MISEESSSTYVEEVRLVAVYRMIDRLQRDYDDFISHVAGFSTIPVFFKDHLYAPDNKQQRDTILEELYEKLKLITGPEMTANIHKLIILIQTTDFLDTETAKALIDGPLRNHTETDGDPYQILTDSQIEDAIFKAGYFEKRVEQVELICETLGFFFALSKLPFVKLIMAPIKVAARMVGAEALIGTMEAGYSISRQIKDMKPFIEAFREREKAYLDRVWSEH